MTPAGWVLLALAPTVPVIAAVAYLSGRNTGRLAQTDDAVGRLSVFVYRLLHSNPTGTSIFLEAVRVDESRYSIEVLNGSLLDTDVADDGGEES